MFNVKHVNMKPLHPITIIITYPTYLNTFFTFDNQNLSVYLKSDLSLIALICTFNGPLPRATYGWFCPTVRFCSLF